MISYDLRAGQLDKLGVEVTYLSESTPNTVDSAAILSVAREMLKIMSWMERNPCIHPANTHSEAKRVMEMYRAAKEKVNAN